MNERIHFRVTQVKETNWSTQISKTDSISLKNAALNCFFFLKSVKSSKTKRAATCS